MSSNLLQRRRTSYFDGRDDRKNTYKKNYYGEGKWKNLLSNSVIHRKASAHVSYSNSQKAAMYSHSRLSTNARNRDDLRLILDGKKTRGRTTATVRRSMDTSASIAVPPETNNIAAHECCVEKMSPDIFLRQASQKMDSLKVSDHHFKLLTDIVYKATQLCMKIKKKKANEDFKREHTFIPGLTLIKQYSPSPSPIAESKFLQEAEDTDTELYGHRASISTADVVFIKEVKNKLCDKSSKTSIVTQSKKQLLPFGKFLDPETKEFIDNFMSEYNQIKESRRKN